MAKKKAKGNDWQLQAVVVKKSHPYGQTKDEAVEVAERHAKRESKAVVEYPKARRVIIRPKACFSTFRGDTRGPHVTVFWGKMKKGARRLSACR